MAPLSRPDRFLLPIPVANDSSHCDPIICLPPPPSSPGGFRASSLVPGLPVAAATLIVSAALAVLLAIFILRRRRRRRHHRIQREDASAAAADHLAPFDNAGEVDQYHIWYIRTTGLDESTIAGIATWEYKADDERVLGISPADCSVCLSEFCDCDVLRVLPKCGHAFHLNCIDTWLRSHVNCPLCRAPVVAPSSTLGGTEPGPSTSFPSALSTSGSLSSGLFHSSQSDGRRSLTGRGTVEGEAAGERLEVGPGNSTAMVRIPNSEDLRLPTGDELDWINRTLRNETINLSTGTTSSKDAQRS